MHAQLAGALHLVTTWPQLIGRSADTSPLSSPPQVLTYKLVERFNIFDANTGALVNVRATHTFDDPKHSLARASAGLVESKLLQMKVGCLAACLLLHSCGPAGLLLRCKSASGTNEWEVAAAVRQGA
jgi:hypothetical protein